MAVLHKNTFVHTVFRLCVCPWSATAFQYNGIIIYFKVTVLDMIYKKSPLQFIEDSYALQWTFYKFRLGASTISDKNLRGFCSVDL